MVACNHSDEVIQMQPLQTNPLPSHPVSMHPLRTKTSSVAASTKKKSPKINYTKLDKQQLAQTKSFIAEVHTYRSQIRVERPVVQLNKPLPPLKNHYTKREARVISENLRKDIDLTAAVVALEPRFVMGNHTYRQNFLVVIINMM